MDKSMDKSKFVLLGIVMSGAFLCMLNQNLISPLLPAVMNTFAVEADTVQWLTSGFSLTAALMIPFAAFLMERFSVFQLFLSAMCIFSAGSFLMGTGISFSIIFMGRILQAVGAGVLMPLAQVVLLQSFPKEKRGSAMGGMALIIAMAPAIGPAISGIAADIIGWFWLFRCITMLGICVLVLAFFKIPRRKGNANVTFDKLSLLLSCLGFGGILYGCSIVNSAGLGSPAVWMFLILGVLSLLAFIKRQYALEKPFLEISVMEVINYRRATVMIMIANASLAGGIVLLPIYVQNVCGYSATASGMLMVPGAVVMGLMGPVVGRIYDKRGPKELNIIGFSLLTVGTAAFCLLNESTPMFIIGVLYTVRMIALGMINSPLMTWAMNSLPDKLAPHGVSVFNTFRQVAGAVGTAVLVVVMRFVDISMCNTNEAGMQGLVAAYGVAAAFAGMALVLSFYNIGKDSQIG